MAYLKTHKQRCLGGPLRSSTPSQAHFPLLISPIHTFRFTHNIMAHTLVANQEVALIRGNYAFIPQSLTQVSLSEPRTRPGCASITQTSLIGPKVTPHFSASAHSPRAWGHAPIPVWFRPVKSCTRRRVTPQTATEGYGFRLGFSFDFVHCRGRINPVSSVV